MTRKTLAFVLVLLMTLNMLTLPAAQAETSIDYDEVLARIDATRDHISDFEASGDLGNPVVKQLSNRLDQAQHQLENGSPKQAIKKMEDFLKHLNNKGMQKFISEAAKLQLTSNANTIIDALEKRPEPTPEPIEYVEIVSDGSANAVVVVPKSSDNSNNTIKGWRRYGTNSGDKIRVVNTKSYSGFHSLHMSEINNNSYGILSNRLSVRVKEGEIYSARVKVFVESGANPVIQIVAYNAIGNAIVRRQVTPGSEGEWVEASWSTGPMPADADNIGIYIAGVIDGSFYVDDVELTRGETGENLIENPGFEAISNTTADTLVEYVQKSSGVELPVVESEPMVHDGVNIYIGQSRAEDEERHQTLLSGLNEHGYIIDVQEDNITILGNTAVATDYGVSEFLERYLGVRWLMPGPDGEHVPKHGTLAIPKELIEDEPASISRHFFARGDSAFNAWYNNNRMIHNIQFHHNMNNLFDPNVFADRPELYVSDEVPTDPSSWQPKFNEETAEVAIDRIIEYFNANPSATSYSLGINDGSRYHEVPGNKYFGVVFTGERGSTGNVHRTDYYARWMNKIAEGVAEVYPDKYLGFLAYREMQDPPKNPDGTPYKLHPNLVPYITLDRMMWANSEFMQIGHEHVEAWHESADNIGWYDYMYGAAYSLPRIYFNQMGENYKFAKDQDIIGHVAELYPNFAGEGPKSWLASKLQWDPDQDVDALLDDWYVSAVGEDAAPYLREYFEFWEEFWTVRILDSNWFPSAPRVYLDFNDLSYLRELTREELYSQLDLLNAVLENTKTDLQKARAECFIEGFEYYETSFLSYPISSETEVEIPSNQEDALEMLDRAKESYAMGKRRLAIPNEFISNSILKHYGGNRGFLDGIQPKYIEALEAYVAANESEGGVVTEQLNSFLLEIGYKVIEANAYRTEASKEEIMESLDFSQGPWENTVAVDKFYMINSKVEPPTETKVRLLWDDEYIYVGYENFDNDISKMVVSDLRADNVWWASGQDDSNETYMTTNPDEPFLGFFSNPKGNKFVRPLSVPTDYVAPEWNYSASVGDDRWTAIQAIPFDLIGVDNPNEISSLHAIFFRSYHGASAYIGWEGGAPWNPAGFNTVNLVD